MQVHSTIRIASFSLVRAGRAYNAKAVRQQIQNQGAVPNILPQRGRLWTCCFRPLLYRGGNAIERMCCRLKEFPHGQGPLRPTATPR
jgi:hypothetical protein